MLADPGVLQPRAGGTSPTAPGGSTRSSSSAGSRVFPREQLLVRPDRRPRRAARPRPTRACSSSSARRRTSSADVPARLQPRVRADGAGDADAMLRRVLRRAEPPALRAARPQPRLELDGCRLPLHLRRVEAGAGGAVHLRAVVERPLGGLDVPRLAAPRLQRRRLQRAAVRERELPRVRARARSSRSGARSRPRRTGRPRGRRSRAPPRARGGRSTSSVRSATSSDARCGGGVVAGEHHVRLQQRALEVDALVVQLGVDAPAGRGRSPVALSSIVWVAVHQHLGLDDRHEARLLGERRIARERVGVRPDAVLARPSAADRVRRAPLREARAEPAVLREPLAQPVETLGDRLAVGERERLRALVDLDPGDDPLRARAASGTACRRRAAGGSSRRRG